MTSNVDIDSIWKALNDEDHQSLSAFNALKVGKTRCSSVSNKGQNAKQKMLMLVKSNSTFDIDRLSAEVKTSSKSSWEDPREVANVPTDTFDEIDFNGTVDDTIGLSMTTCCDSDDSDDDGEVDDKATTAVNGDHVRIERLAGHLKSDYASSRVAALSSLKAVVTALAHQCPSPPELNFLPPFEESKIKLDRNLPLVSDLPVNQRELICSSNKMPSQQEICDNSNDIQRSAAARDRLQVILDSCGKNLFRLIGDNNEKCRGLSLECLNLLFLSGVDMARHIPYLIPALSSRYSICAYDKDLEVFVTDDVSHEFYKRGGAIDRQDRDGLLGQSNSALRQFIEPNEEFRLALCRTFDSLLRGVRSRNSLPLIDAYFSDIILSLQSSLKDPFPDVKAAACQLLVHLMRAPQWEVGAKHFALGLARAVLPNLRHRKTQVILAALDLFEASVCVPDRAKAKGAGSLAISDLVGFRQENVSMCGERGHGRDAISCHVKASHSLLLRYFQLQHFMTQVVPSRSTHWQNWPRIKMPV
jgi:hypothetical protein